MSRGKNSTKASSSSAPAGIEPNSSKSKGKAKATDSEDASTVKPKSNQKKRTKADQDDSDAESDDEAETKSRTDAAGGAIGDETAGGGGGKRKRKRKRKSRTGAAAAGEEEDDETGAPAEAGSTKRASQVQESDPEAKPKIFDSAYSQPSLDSIPDPLTDDQLVSTTDAEADPADAEALSGTSSPCQNALAYAIAFVRGSTPDGTPWRFSKARQNWILRHLLVVATPPPSSSSRDEEEKEVTAETQGEKEGVEKETEPDVAPAQQQAAQAIPDEYLPPIGWYLRGLKGGARDKLVGELRAARDAPTVTLAPAPAPAQPATSTAAPGKKSVSFGDLALEMDISADAKGSSSLSLDAQSQLAKSVESKRARAIELLRWIGEA